MRVMLVDDMRERAALVERALADADFQLVCSLTSTQGLMKQVADHEPDVVIVNLDSPDRDMLEHMSVLIEHMPRPVVMFAKQGDPSTIEESIRAGISAYVVDGLEPHRIGPVLNGAVARFREFQALRNELEDTRRRLADRQVIDRAKALLIQRRNLAEEEAYHAMRKLAMNNSRRLVDVANEIVAMLGTGTLHRGHRSQ